MENYKQKKKFETIVACSVLFLVALVSVAVVSFVKLGNARKRNAEYDALIASLTIENKNVNKSLEDMASYDYLEEQARNRLGMVKGDETNIQFVEK